MQNITAAACMLSYMWLAPQAVEPPKTMLFRMSHSGNPVCAAPLRLPFCFSGPFTVHCAVQSGCLVDAALRHDSAPCPVHPFPAEIANT